MTRHVLADVSASGLKGFIFGFHVQTLGLDWGYLIPDYSCADCDTAKGKLVRFGMEDFSSIHVLDLTLTDPIPAISPVVPPGSLLFPKAFLGLLCCTL